MDTASDMADSIARFLTIFGLRRELDEMRRRVEEAVAKQSEKQTGGALTQAKWLRESGRGEDEYVKGDLRAASARFTTLLVRIEAQPEETPVGRGSYEHCLTLGRLARCLRAKGQLIAAEQRLREALAIIEALLKKQPENEGHIRQRGAFLSDLGNVLGDQGKYSEAGEAYKEMLKIAEQQADARSQAVVQTQLGTLALLQRDYDEAQSCYASALARLQTLGEPATEAGVWHQLGMVAEKQNEWAEAEYYYRESLTLKERVGDTAGAARTCNQLALVAENAGRPTEAEGWCKRALELDKQVHSSGFLHAS